MSQAQPGSFSPRSGDRFLLGFNVGNSRIQAGLVAREGVVWVDAFVHANDRQSEDLGNWLDGLVDNRRIRSLPLRVAVASVNPRVSDMLAHQLSRIGLEPNEKLASDGVLFRRGVLASAVETPNTIGVDRLLGVCGALSRSPGRPVLVFDCGTAITANLATSDRTFLGGAILPGLRLMAESLQQGTAQLPSATVSGETWHKVALGKSTREAIQSGVFFAAVGAMERLAEELPGHRDVAIFLTGGDAPYLSPSLRVRHTIVTTLVLEGLADALEHAGVGRA